MKQKGPTYHLDFLDKSLGQPVLGMLIWDNIGEQNSSSCAIVLKLLDLNSLALSIRRTLTGYSG